MLRPTGGFPLSYGPAKGRGADAYVWASVDPCGGQAWPSLRPCSGPRAARRGKGQQGGGGEDGAVSGRHGEVQPGAWSPSMASGSHSWVRLRAEASPPPSKPPVPTAGPLLPGVFSLKKISRDFFERAIRESRRPVRSRRLWAQPSPLPPRQERGDPGCQGRRRPAYPNSGCRPGKRSLSSLASRALRGGTHGCL